MCRLLFAACALLIHVCHAGCPDQLPDTVSPRTNGRCQLFPRQQLFCSQFFRESSMVYIHDNINYTLLNERLFEWRSNGSFGNTILNVLDKPSAFCSTQIPYMVCIYLYPPCDAGVPLAFCQDQCNDLRLECCDATNNLAMLVSSLNNSSPLQLLCDYDNVNRAGNLYPYPAGDPSCYNVRSAPRIINDTQLNITGIDYTVSTGNSINPCIYQFNNSYALVCNVTGMPAPQLTWYYQSTLPEEVVMVNITDGFLQYNIDNNTSVLVINNLTRNNAGIYYCNATNDIGFDLLTIQAFVAHCNDSDGVCHPIAKAFTQNCSKCIYPNNDCVIQCDPILCPSMLPNNCDRIVPTSDGCCMTCAASEDTEDNGLSAGVTAAITVIAVVVILLLMVVLIFLCFKQTIKPRKSNQLNIHRLNMTLNRTCEGAPQSVYNVISKSMTTEELPQIKYNKIFSDLSDVEIPLEVLSIGTELGEGAFGTVYKGTVTINNTDDSPELIDVAVKTINADALDSDEVESFLNECVLMKKMEHINVLSLLGVCLDTEDGLPYIILPYMDNGDLKTFLHSKRTTSGSVLTHPEGLEHAVLLRMCCDISYGMKYLAHHKFVHRDLAARNCLVSSDMTIKVGDFGLARQLYSKDYYKLRHRAKVPIKWMPLESIHDGVFNEKTDVWAFGVTCWEVFTLGATPYSALEFEDMLLFIGKGSRLSKPQLCSQKVYMTLLKCWELSPDNRPSFSVVAEELTELLLPNEYVNIRNSEHDE